MATISEMLVQGRHYQRAGNTQQAEQIGRQILQTDSGNVEALHLVAVCLHATGRLAGAVEHYQRLLYINPTRAEVHNDLGTALGMLDRLDEAISEFQWALTLKPNFVQAHNNLGTALAIQGSLDRAIAAFQQVLRLKPDHVEAHNNLGNALRTLGRFSEATAHLQEAVRLKPTFAEAHNNLGLALHEQDRLDEARASFEQALRLRPNYADAHCSLGLLLEVLGDLPAAEACFREAIRHQPDNAEARAALATMLRGKLPDADQTAMQELLATRCLCESKRSALHFGLAQVLDARGDYGAAAEHARQANALELGLWRKRGRGYDPAEHARFVEQIREAFTPDLFGKVRGWGLPSERPVFIFGLPRSGTTLAEQILASHSQVHGAGELHFTSDDFEALARMADLPAAPATSVTVAGRASDRAVRNEQAFVALRHLNQEVVQQLAKQHLVWLEGVNATAARVISKMPSNWMYLGLLAVLFPRARFIHCRRDLRDVAVSCWMTRFQHLSWTCDQDYIACRFASYRRLMEHWRQCLPVPMLEIDYEETVADPEGTARKLVSWLGLEWEPQCLNFHKTQRPVRTASAAQVRQPIYGRSVARWKNYELALGSLFRKCLPQEQANVPSRNGGDGTG